jgi:hypothetical protein
MIANLDRSFFADIGAELWLPRPLLRRLPLGGRSERQRLRALLERGPVGVNTPRPPRGGRETVRPRVCKSDRPRHNFKRPGIPHVHEQPAAARVAFLRAEKSGKPYRSPQGGVPPGGHL